MSILLFQRDSHCWGTVVFRWCTRPDCFRYVTTSLTSSVNKLMCGKFVSRNSFLRVFLSMVFIIWELQFSLMHSLRAHTMLAPWSVTKINLDRMSGWRPSFTSLDSTPFRHYWQFYDRRGIRKWTVLCSTASSYHQNNATLVLCRIYVYSHLSTCL
jgi:hypothetical protein